MVKVLTTKYLYYQGTSDDMPVVHLQTWFKYLVISVVVGMLLVEVVGGHLVDGVVRVLRVVVVSVGVVDRPCGSGRVVKRQRRPSGQRPAVATLGSGVQGVGSPG